MKLPVLSALAALAFLSGCASVKTVQIAADGAMAAASVQVDVAKYSPETRDVSVSQYFSPGSSVRSAASAQTRRFGAGQSATQDVSTAGLGKRAVVLADLPGAHSDAMGDADARRKIIPLKGKLPDGRKVTKIMRVNVTQSGLTVTPVGK